MTHNETRISNERLAEMVAGMEKLPHGPWFSAVAEGQNGTAGLAQVDNGAEMWPVIAEWPEAAHIARCDPDTIRAMILELQALRSTPVETEPDFYALHSPTRSHIGLWPKKDDAEQAQREYENSTLTPLYARLLPNPSPSDGEVSEEWKVGDKVTIIGTGTVGEITGLRPRSGEAKVFYHNSVMNRDEEYWFSFGALQSKRGQP